MIRVVSYVIVCVIYVIICVSCNRIPYSLFLCIVIYVMSFIDGSDPDVSELRYVM